MVILQPNKSQYNTAYGMKYSDRNSVPFSTRVQYCITSEKFFVFTKDIDNIIFSVLTKIFNNLDVIEIINTKATIANSAIEEINKLIYPVRVCDLNLFQIEDSGGDAIKRYQDGVTTGYLLKGVSDGSKIDPTELAEKVANILSKSTDE